MNQFLLSLLLCHSLLANDQLLGSEVAKLSEREKQTQARSPEESLKTKTIAVNLVSIPSLPSITSGLRMLCTPVSDFIHGSLDVGGSKWGKLQFTKGATGAPSEYRGTVAATCTLAMQRLRDVAFSKSAWDVILPQAPRGILTKTHSSSSLARSLAASRKAHGHTPRFFHGLDSYG